MQYSTGNSPHTDFCVKLCVYNHELSHAEDALKAEPDICQDKADGTQVLSSDSEERAASEIKASQVEIDCLNSGLTSKCPVCNRKAVRNRIKQMEKYRDSFK